MKKFFTFLTVSLILTGCSIGEDMSNTPTKRVEEYLNNYQTLDSNVLAKLDAIVNNEEVFDEDQKITYRDILKKHYQDLTYTIKEETVNGDKATVETEIEVTDYTKALKEAESYRTTNESEFLDDNEEFNETKFNSYRLELIKDSKERVKYTIYFSLTKENDEWVKDEEGNPVLKTFNVEGFIFVGSDLVLLSEEEKILGIYEY